MNKKEITTRQIAKFVTIYLLSNIFFILLAEVILKISNNKIETTNGTLLISYFLTLMTFGIPVIFGKNFVNNVFEIKKFDRSNTLKTIMRGYFYLFIFGLSLTLIDKYVINISNIPGFENQELDIIINENTKLLSGILAICVAPIIEELFFRQIILSSLVKKLNYAAASLVTAVLFALGHLQFKSFFPIFILGLIINYLYKKSDYNVISVIIFHMINNAVAFLLYIKLG